MRNKKNKGESVLKKVGSFLEEKPQEEIQPVPEPEKKKSPLERQKALITYVALLFGVSFLFVLVSLISQRQNFTELDAYADSVVSKAEQLQSENRDLSAANQELLAEIETMTAENETLNQDLEAARQAAEAAQTEIDGLEAQLTEARGLETQRVKAYELVLAAGMALDREDRAAFDAAMSELETLSHYLDQEGKALYQELRAVFARNTEE